MKTARIQILVGFFLTVAVIVVFRVFTTPRPAPVLTNAETSLQLKRYALKEQHLERDDALTVAAYAGILSSACLAVIILASGWHRGHVKRAKVHTYKIDNNEIIVHERDLSMAWQICTGLVNAQALEQSNRGLDKAFDLYQTMALVQTAQLKALLGRKGLHQAALPRAENIDIQTSDGFSVPTFGELLRSGHIASDRPLVFGYAHGVPKTGTWKDIYSNATGGQSGSGKTNTLRSLIAQSVIQGVHFWIVDYHWPHEESLLASLGHVKDSLYVSYADKPIDVRPLLEQVDATIDRRKRNEEPSTPIRVLCIDELLQIVKNCNYAETVIERIGTEGRKFGVYGLFSAQSWKAKNIDTTARDNLTSIFAHYMKPNQAKVLLQDSDRERQVKKLRQGQMLFCPRNGMDEVIDVPFCSQEDIKLVANMVGYAVTNFGNASGNVTKYSTPVTGTGNALETPKVTDEDSPVVRLRTLAQQPGFSQSKTARDMQMNKGYLNNILNGKKPSPDAIRKIATWLRTHDTSAEIIPFPQKH
jgi:hypothetical protein